MSPPFTTQISREPPALLPLLPLPPLLLPLPAVVLPVPPLLPLLLLPLPLLLPDSFRICCCMALYACCPRHSRIAFNTGARTRRALHVLQVC